MLYKTQGLLGDLAHLVSGTREDTGAEIDSAQADRQH